MTNIVAITGASSGFGALTARTLAKTGNTVYAGMRETTDPNAPQVQAAADFSTANAWTCTRSRWTSTPRTPSTSRSRRSRQSTVASTF